MKKVFCLCLTCLFAYVSTAQARVEFIANDSAITFKTLKSVACPDGKKSYNGQCVTVCSAAEYPFATKPEESKGRVVSCVGIKPRYKYSGCYEEFGYVFNSNETDCVPKDCSAYPLKDCSEKIGNYQECITAGNFGNIERKCKYTRCTAEGWHGPIKGECILNDCPKNIFPYYGTPPTGDLKLGETIECRSGEVNHWGYKNCYDLERYEFKDGVCWIKCVDYVSKEEAEVGCLEPMTCAYDETLEKCEKCDVNKGFKEEPVLGVCRCDTGKGYDENPQDGICIITNPQEEDDECEVGYIYYADDTCSDALIKDKEPIGVVVSNTPGEKWVVGLEEKELLWLTGLIDGKYANTPNIPGLKDYAVNQCPKNDYNGKSNTDIILKYGKEKNLQYPAAEYCVNYKAGGKSWYLPALGQLHRLRGISGPRAKLDLLGKGLKYSSGGENKNDVYYWSSTEMSPVSVNESGVTSEYPDEAQAWLLNLRDNSYCFSHPERDKMLTRCMFNYTSGKLAEDDNGKGGGDDGNGGDDDLSGYDFLTHYELGDICPDVEIKWTESRAVLAKCPSKKCNYGAQYMTFDDDIAGSGFEKLSACVEPLDVLYEDGTTGSGTNIDKSKKVIGIVFDKTNHWAVSVKDDGKNETIAEAIETCKKKKDGGLSWDIPTFKQMDNLCHLDVSHDIKEINGWKNGYNTPFTSFFCPNVVMAQSMLSQISGAKAFTTSAKDSIYKYYPAYATKSGQFITFQPSNMVESFMTQSHANIKTNFTRCFADYSKMNTQESEETNDNNEQQCIGVYTAQEAAEFCDGAKECPTTAASTTKYVCDKCKTSNGFKADPVNGRCVCDWNNKDMPEGCISAPSCKDSRGTFYDTTCYKCDTSKGYEEMPVYGVCKKDNCPGVYSKNEAAGICDGGGLYCAKDNLFRCTDCLVDRGYNPKAVDGKCTCSWSNKNMPEGCVSAPSCKDSNGTFYGTTCSSCDVEKGYLEEPDENGKCKKDNCPGVYSKNEAANICDGGAQLCAATNTYRCSACQTSKGYKAEPVDGKCEKEGGKKTLDKCAVGDFYYEDNTCNSELVPGDNPIGVVYDTTNYLVASLNLEGGFYNSSPQVPEATIAKTYAEAKKDMNGARNYRKILNAKTGVGCEENAGGKSWYVPAWGEIGTANITTPVIESLTKAAQNKDKIAAMKYNNRTQLSYGRLYAVFGDSSTQGADIYYYKFWTTGNKGNPTKLDAKITKQDFEEALKKSGGYNYYKCYVLNTPCQGCHTEMYCPIGSHWASASSTKATPNNEVTAGKRCIFKYSADGRTPYVGGNENYDDEPQSECKCPKTKMIGNRCLYEEGGVSYDNSKSGGTGEGDMINEKLGYKRGHNTNVDIVEDSCGNKVCEVCSWDPIYNQVWKIKAIECKKVNDYYYINGSRYQKYEKVTDDKGDLKIGEGSYTTQTVPTIEWYTGLHFDGLRRGYWDNIQSQLYHNNTLQCGTNGKTLCFKKQEDCQNFINEYLSVGTEIIVGHQQEPIDSIYF